MPKLKYKRILLKLSGEAFGKSGQGIDEVRLTQTAKEIAAIHHLGVELGIVVGGGNIWRKRDNSKAIDWRTSDYLGLLATVMNALALQQALAKQGVKVRTMNAVAADIPIAERFSRPRALKALKLGQVLIFGAGTGKPGFTTDTGAALRAADIKAQAIVKLSQVDGVYSADPKKVKSAKRYTRLTIAEALQHRLAIMDKQAFALCRKHNMPIIVCKWGKGVVQRVVMGEGVGTLVMP